MPFDAPEPYRDLGYVEASAPPSEIQHGVQPRQDCDVAHSRPLGSSEDEEEVVEPAGAGLRGRIGASDVQKSRLQGEEKVEEVPEIDFGPEGAEGEEKNGQTMRTDSERELRIRERGKGEGKAEKVIEDRELSGTEVKMERKRNTSVQSSAIHGPLQLRKHHCLLNGHIFRRVWIPHSVSWRRGQRSKHYLEEVRCEDCGRDVAGEVWVCEIMVCGRRVCRRCERKWEVERRARAKGSWE